MASAVEVGALPMTLRQAGLLLNVDPKRLYYRCLLKRIEYVKDRSRYLIPPQEIERLRIVGIY